MMTTITIAAEKKLSASQLARLSKKHGATFAMHDKHPRFLAGTAGYVAVDGCRSEGVGEAVASVDGDSAVLVAAQADIAAALGCVR